MTTEENQSIKIEIPASGFVSFLPWLRLPCWVDFNGFKFIRYPDPTGKFPKLEFLDRLFSSYRDSHGQPVPDVTLVMCDDSALGWNVPEKHYSEIRQFSKLLFLACISANEYYNPMASYCCSSQFALVGQRFQSNMEGPAITSRRKDGNSNSFGPTFEELHFINPPHYKSNGMVDLDIPLLNALVALYKTNLDLKSHILAATDLLYLGSSDSNDIVEETEVILIASAFEQLLNCDGKAREVAGKLSDLFSTYFTLDVDKGLQTRPEIPVEERYRDAQLKWPLHKLWMKDFYDLRSNIVHGNERSTWKHGWNLTEHLTFAIYIFPLAVKLLLSADKLYKLTEDDDASCKAIDQILASRDWHEPTDGSSINARFNVIRRGEDKTIQNFLIQLNKMGL